MKRTAIAVGVWVAALGVPQASAFDWSGFYAGLGIGGLNGGYSDSFGDSILYSGATLEGFAGYRIELLMLTLGAEVDASYFLPTDREVQGGLATDSTAIGKASARGTIAMEIGPLLPFVSAGVALAAQRQNPSSNGKDTVAHPGIVFGAGVDVALTDHVFARLEGSYSIFAEGSADDGLGPYLGKLDDQADIRAGLGWKF